MRTLGYVAHAGFFYTGNADQLGVQLLGVLVLLCWTVGTSGLVFGLLSAGGLLRISSEDEAAGVDVAEHGEKLLVEMTRTRVQQATRTSSRSVEVEADAAHTTSAV